MDGSAHFFVGQCRDDTFNLPPMAESQNIARVPALLSSRGGLQSGVIAKTVDEVGSLCKGKAAGDEGRIHASR